MAKKRREHFELNDLNVVENVVGNEAEDKKKSFIYRLPGLGIVFALISALFYALNSLFAKMVNQHAMEMGLARMYVQFLILLPLMFYKRDTVDVLGPVGYRKFLWMIGAINSVAILCLYFALSELTLGNAVTITYLSMIMGPIFARIFLKEPLVVSDFIFAGISLTGVVLISKPTFLFPNSGEESSTSLMGVLNAVISAALQALVIICIRKVGKDTYVHLNVFYHTFCGLVVFAVVGFPFQFLKLPCLRDLLFLILLGITGLLASSFLTMALRMERAGTISVLRSIQIIMVYILQVVVLGNIPEALDLIGASLVLVSSIGIGTRKIINERRKKPVT